MTVRSTSSALRDRTRDRPVTVFNATGSGAIALSATGGRFRLVEVTVKFSTIPTTSEDATLTLDANDGSGYDAVLARVDPSTGTGTGDVVISGDDHIYESGDELDLAFTNTDARTYGARIVVEPV